MVAVFKSVLLSLFRPAPLITAWCVSQAPASHRSAMLSSPASSLQDVRVLTSQSHGTSVLLAATRNVYIPSLILLGLPGAYHTRA